MRVETYEAVAPATADGIRAYLGSGLIRGLGPVMAGRLVDLFGEHTLEVIESSPERLTEVEGIGKKRIALITEAWDEQREIRNVMIFLQSHGVSSAYAAKIFKHYGKDAIATVRTNPYRLAADIRGIGFLTADRIAASLGLPPDSPMRAQEGLVYVLNDLVNTSGHVCYPLEPLVAKAAGLLGMEREIVSRALDALLKEGRIVAEQIGATEATDADANAVYLSGLYSAETGLAKGLLALSGRPSFRTIDAGGAIAWVEQKLDIILADMQRDALAEIAHSRLLVVTGGPGTGKTTIIRAACEIFDELGMRTLLAAPTGRAAKRIEEAAGRDARTIHRMLEYRDGYFQRDRLNPLEADAVIVDEASMIDVALMHRLVEAIPGHASLILVGDTDQLPSVGPGAVLEDIIGSQVCPVVTLDHIFRQGEESLIVANSHRINRGEFPLSRRSGDTADFYFVEEDDPEEILEWIVQLVSQDIPRRFGLSPLRDIQVLSPMHRGAVGVANLNARLQETLNPRELGATRGSETYRVGDRVIQTVNSYDRDVYNGDVGFISAIDAEDHLVTVDFDDHRALYEFTDLDELDLAYAISVHKSQGSEYPAVVMPVTTQHYVMLARNLLYTGITRGRSLVVLVGTKKALGVAIRNNKTRMRYTLLGKRLSGI